VRFWLLPRSETRPAKELAQEGAVSGASAQKWGTADRRPSQLKSNQQPGLVKWRKKKLGRNA
jgi:hypothetical protein